MAFRQTADGTDQAASGPWFNENIRGAVVVVVGAMALVGIAFGVMSVLTSPDGWITKAASQAFSTAQQGTMASAEFTTAE